MKRLSIIDHRQRMEALAAPLLTYLAADPERFDRFLALTGLSVTGLREASREDGFAAHLWTYLASDEALLIGFAQEQALDLEEVAKLAAAAAQPPEMEEG